MNPWLDGVHDPVHRREQRRGPCSVQGADGREGGLVEESPRTARQVTPFGSVRLVRLCHRVCHQAPDCCLLRFAAGPGVSWPIPPSSWHGTAGSAKGGGGWGSGREHVRQVRNGCGVPQVQVDPQKGSVPGARAFVGGGVCPLDAPVQGLLLCVPARACGGSGPGACGHLGAPRAPVYACPRCGGHRVTFPADAGRCVGGGRATTKGRDGGARGRPTSVRGGPGSPAGGRGRGASSPCRASSAGPPATCHRGESRGRGRRR